MNYLAAALLNFVLGFIIIYAIIQVFYCVRDLGYYYLRFRVRRLEKKADALRAEYDDNMRDHERRF